MKLELHKNIGINLRCFFHNNNLSGLNTCQFYKCYNKNGNYSRMYISYAFKYKNYYL